ncbi:hypothetical protein SAMN05880558_101121 [Aeromonas sp. RU39B]|jgi:DNA-binding GntR family transcriptional regulator|uniref:hypothetical protein n=1 Tax=Aeromonas sp. RU39B TaxID=1907416 RepID=UPI000955F5E8|nr:hypothetical protein [Aeromonas sp. RU39B]SIP89449.1 hypothetical protein SAMN05880558_101121 [Aeromonas sp. RU39B]
MKTGFILLLLALPLAAKQQPTAECLWLHQRIEALDQAIAKGDHLKTEEERERWKAEFHKKGCEAYDY